VIEIQEIKVPTVSIHDLIALKKKAGRRQDLSDIEYLKIILEK
jgi:predicted nucleotidyltransferase